MWFIFLIVVLVILYFKLKKTYQYWETRQVAFIRPWPILGNLGRFLFGQISLAEDLQNMYNMYPNKRYIGIYQFLKPTLLISDIDLLKQLTIKDFDHFIDRRTFVSEDDDPMFGKNLLQLKGQKWKDMRSTLSPTFSGSKMRFMFTLIKEMGEQFTEFLSRNVNAEKAVTFEMKDLFTRLANDVIATTAFGIKCDSLNDRDNKFFYMGRQVLFDGFLDTLKVFGYALSPRIMSLLKVKIFNDNLSAFFTEIIQSAIKIREEKNIFRPDMIYLLMEARKGRLKQDEAKNVREKSKIDLTDELMVAQALLFFFAGFETMSTLFCHMANELALNQDVQQKLRNEIDETIEKCNGELTYEIIMEMKYMDMVINETLRKWPPTPLIERVSVKPYIIPSAGDTENSLYLPKGQHIWIPIFAIHRDPQNFADPERFDPERFSNENKDSIKPFSHIPFGLGPRNCIGARFALLEAKVIYFSLLSKFKLTVVKETQIPLKLKRCQFNIHAEKGFYVGLKARN